MACRDVVGGASGVYVVAQLFRNAFVNAHVVSTIKKERQLQAARMMCSGLQLLCIVDRKRALNERVRNEIGPKVRGRWNQDLSIARGSLPRNGIFCRHFFKHKSYRQAKCTQSDAMLR